MDLWPYVSGRALTNNLSLGEMRCADMLNVLHYYFEDDHSYDTAEAALRVSAMRETVYENLYGVKYQYALKDPGSGSASVDIDSPLDNGIDAVDQPIQPFVPRRSPAKAYTPPTEQKAGANPFDGILDAPIR